MFCRCRVLKILSTPSNHRVDFVRRTQLAVMLANFVVHLSFSLVTGKSLVICSLSKLFAGIVKLEQTVASPHLLVIVKLTHVP